MPVVRTKYNAHPDEFWQKISDQYNELLSENDGGTRKIVARLAEKRGISRSSAYTLVAGARRYGFLDPFSHRICSYCRQPKARNTDGQLIVMEMNAGDYAEFCEQQGLESAAAHFKRAALALERASGESHT